MLDCEKLKSRHKRKRNLGRSPFVERNRGSFEESLKKKKKKGGPFVLKRMVQHRYWAQEACGHSGSSGDRLVSHGKIKSHPTVSLFSVCLSPH